MGGSSQQPSIPSTGSPSPLFVLDTSSAIKVKYLYPKIADQQKVFQEFTQLVKRRQMTFPRQVVNELLRVAEGDMPALWIKSVVKYHKFTDAPPIEYLKTVLKVASDKYFGHTRTVVDPLKTHEDADPYVLAHALALQEQGHKVIVVTNDRHDTEDRLAIVTACKMLKLHFLTTVPFLESLGFSCK